MKKALSVAAVALMAVGSTVYAGEKAECTAKKECSEKKACSADKSAECSAKKAECPKDK
jgi:hypothetical protein